MLGLLFAALGDCAAAAPPPDNCTLDRQAEIQVTMLRNIPMVVTFVNGEAARMILDTGAERTVLSETAARRLKLQTDWSQLSSSQGVGGRIRYYGLKADTFEVGAVKLHDRPFSVGVVGWKFGSDPPDGFLGSDVLSMFDVDVDLGGGRVTLYRPRKCQSGTPPWGVPYETLPLTQLAPDHALYSVPVTVDGHLLKATLDTGAETTSMATRTANALGIGSDVLSHDRSIDVTGFGPNTAYSHVHRFREIKIGKEGSANPMLSVIDLPEFAGDMLLGADFLRQHRVWLSYTTQRVFVSLP